MITVFLANGAEKLLVGRIVAIGEKNVFQYDTDFLSHNLSLSPFKLPLQSGIVEMPKTPFNGLHGVFADSLPDGWGLMLMDRYLRQQGMDMLSISPLDRLLFIGSTAMGALLYEPDHSVAPNNRIMDLLAISREASAVYHGNKQEVLPELIQAGGSPGGARPKVVVGMNGETIVSGERELPPGFDAWIIKFHTSKSKNSSEGIIEEGYARMARLASINMPDTQLISVDDAHYFAVKRFDRNHNERLHIHSLAGLMHANFRVPDFDYAKLMQVTKILTHNTQDMQQVFRQMVFNLLSHNQDDHTKNFSFMMDAHGKWRLTPAYDITFNYCHNGEQSMAVNGHGKDIPEHVFYSLGEMCELSGQAVTQIFEQTFDALSNWSSISKELGLDDAMSKDILGKFDGLYNRYAAMC